ARLPVRHARSGRIPQWQFEYIGQPRNQTAIYAGDTMKPLAAQEALDRYFLEARSKLLDVAAILDRIDRGGKLTGDPRLEQIRRALVVLEDTSANRAER